MSKFTVPLTNLFNCIYIYKVINTLYCLFKTIFGISCENENKSQTKSDQVQFSSTDDEIVRSSNNSVNGENSNFNI